MAMIAPDLVDLIDALGELQARFECDQVAATYQQPSGNIITLRLFAGELLTISDDLGNEYAVQMKDRP
jgi:hypothetical protein